MSSRAQRSNIPALPEGICFFRHPERSEGPRFSFAIDTPILDRQRQLRNDALQEGLRGFAEIERVRTKEREDIDLIIQKQLHLAEDVYGKQSPRWFEFARRAHRQAEAAKLLVDEKAAAKRRVLARDVAIEIQQLNNDPAAASLKGCVWTAGRGRQDAKFRQHSTVRHRAPALPVLHRSPRDTRTAGEILLSQVESLRD